MTKKQKIFILMCRHNIKEGQAIDILEKCDWNLSDAENYIEDMRTIEW